MFTLSELDTLLAPAIDGRVFDDVLLKQHLCQCKQSQDNQNISNIGRTKMM